jgi:dTDP-4-amino-4,6-dideoxygalactose transaminase
MPSFTFAAAGQAALRAGLTPHFCDVDQDRWAMSCRSAEELLDQYGKDVAVIFPYASFGTDIDLDQFLELSRRYCVPIVIDAAASLGTLALDGRSFGSGFPFPIVFSMHVTKLFATAEAGLIYCYDKPTAERLRAMTNFGFEESRHATIPGLNGKLPEVIARRIFGRCRLPSARIVGTAATPIQR